MFALGVIVYVMLTGQYPWDAALEDEYEENPDFMPNDDQIRGNSRQRPHF